MAFRYGFHQLIKIFLYNTEGPVFALVTWGSSLPMGQSHFFSTCLQRDDPVNRSLPEYFYPIYEVPETENFPIFGHDSHLASALVEKTQANSQSS